MSRPVQTGAGPMDVLSNLVEYVEDFRQEPETECRAALAAVAELVAYAELALLYVDEAAVAGHESPYSPLTTHNLAAQLRAALAKFGGGA